MTFEPIKHFGSHDKVTELELRVKMLENKLKKVKELISDPISDYLAIYKIREVLKD